MTIVKLNALARLPAAGDNAAIVTRRVDAGTRVAFPNGVVTLAWTVLEGHRLAVAPIEAGAPLLSWGLPFGYALRDIRAGEYLCNARTLDALRLRDLDFPLPPEPNFRDTDLAAYAFDETAFTPGTQVAPAPGAAPPTFMGYDRGAARGVGTRNHIVILATSSRTGGWARALDERLKGLAPQGMDAVVSVTHTEGGGAAPNNRALLLRTLAGFAVHPNVGAVLIVDRGDEAVTGADLRRYMRDQRYPLDDVLHRFVTLRDSFDADLARGAELIEGWLGRVAATPRSEQPLSTLKLGLQCGGSDAFSGVSGNPLAAWVAREVVRHGGAANLAETDELIGAEAYILSNVRDLATARRFLAVVDRFKERVAWHGHTAEGNPSGGNHYRGLANIALKSLGAAAKRDPAVRLDHVIDYAEPMSAAGFTFMDSPGNDLESVAGQVASGCTLLYFVTGNGSITNFPFVPTIKIVTTTGRYELLRDEMDVNAGAYLDGAPKDALGADLLARTLAVAGGDRTAGERAGHSQVSIWRDWPRSGPDGLAAELARPAPSGRPLLTAADLPLDDADRALAGRRWRAYASLSGPVHNRVGLVLPTSLCAGQIARRIAGWLDREEADHARISRYVALPHTEGCGVSSGASEELFVQTLVGHLTHPLVSLAVLLEHGCEKTHNDYLRHALRERALDSERFGWASIQLDGGIDTVERKVVDWFAKARRQAPLPVHVEAGVGDLRLGVAAGPDVSPALRTALSRLARLVVASGGTVVTPTNAAALPDARIGAVPDPTLAYAAPATPGLHVMDTPTTDWAETTTGLGATGVEIIVACPGARPLAGHRLVPVIQVSDAADNPGAREDFDLVLSGDLNDWTANLLDLVIDVLSRATTPKAFQRADVEFQITRGRLGVSM